MKIFERYCENIRDVTCICLSQSALGDNGLTTPSTTPKGLKEAV